MVIPDNHYDSDKRKIFEELNRLDLSDDPEMQKVPFLHSFLTETIKGDIECHRLALEIANLLKTNSKFGQTP